MIDCTFFDETGQITQVAQLSEETFEHYVNAGALALLDVKGNPETQYVVDNELVNYTPEELLVKRSLGHGWAWKMPERMAVATISLPDHKARSILDVDRFADAARLKVVGDAARIKEYERAQSGAEQYRDAGYTGPVPPGVASWARAKRRDEWTARQAADDILAASARWYAALDGIRDLRLDAKESIRFAETIQEVEAIASTFRTTLTAAMQGVQ